ncbi:unnamed protein product, partial [marine sediment metagenome]
MTLDALLEDRKSIQARLCYLLEQDEEEFKKILRNIGRPSKTGFKYVKSTIIKKKLGLEGTNHTTSKGITSSTFFYGRIENDKLDLREIYQRLDLSDNLLLQFFIDYFPKEKIAGNMDMASAIVAESAALFLAETASYNEFSKREKELFRQRKSMDNYLFENLSKIQQLCITLYERMYDEWKNPSKTSYDLRKKPKAE